MKKVILSLMMLLSSTLVSAEVIAPSLEWMVQSTPIIVRGKVIDVKKTVAGPEAPLWTVEDIVFKVEEVLKGNIQPQAYISFKRLHIIQTSAIDWRMENSDLIVFLGQDTGGSLVATYDLPFAPINLDHLNENTIVMADFDVKRDRDEIVKLIKDTLKTSEEKNKKPANVAIPENTEAYRALWSGSACYLIVPQ